MNKKVALIVIFNHRYDKNLPILEDMYRTRFSNRYYLVPFYDGDMKNVIPVYGRSIFFEGYIAQGFNSFFKEEYEHYLFVADDMIIHPKINEDNYQQFFEVNEGQSYIPRLMPLHTAGKFWLGTLAAFCYRKKQKYVEVDKELPSYKDAVKRMNNQGVEIRELARKEIFGPFTIKIGSTVNKARLGIRILTRLKNPFKRRYRLNYPLIGSYSDIILVSAESIKDFIHYCGVFASTSLFAEIAIPTALVLASNKKIVTENQMKHQGMSYWHGSENVFWYSQESDISTLENKFKDLDDIIQNFPDNFLYMHPVKLSKWINKNKQ